MPPEISRPTDIGQVEPTDAAIEAALKGSPRGEFGRSESVIWRGNVWTVADVDAHANHVHLTLTNPSKAPLGSMSYGD